VLQHPERVIPLSECERFEPHFQPNVALAPIPTPAQMVQIPPSVHQQRQRHHHEHSRRHSHHISSSPTNDKRELLSSANVKLEKTSPNQVSAVGSYPLYYVPDGGQKETPSKEKKTDKEGEEEESSAAVTSSTVNVEPMLAASSEVGTSSPESDSDSDGTAAADLEERLRTLDVPQDVIELARRVASENAQLRRHRRSDAREISKLRSSSSSSSSSSNNKNKNNNLSQLSARIKRKQKM